MPAPGYVTRCRSCRPFMAYRNLTLCVSLHDYAMTRSQAKAHSVPSVDWSVWVGGSKLLVAGVMWVDLVFDDHTPSSPDFRA